MKSAGKNESDCGKACEELSSKQFEFHLQALKMGMPGGPSSLSECLELSGYSTRGTDSSVRSNATKIHANSRLQAALASHRAGKSFDEAELREKAMRLLGDIIGAVDPEAAQPKDGIAATNTAAKILGWFAPEKHLDVTPIVTELEAAARAGDLDAEDALAKIGAGGDFATHYAEWKARRADP